MRLRKTALTAPALPSRRATWESRVRWKCRRFHRGLAPAGGRRLQALRAI